MGTAVTGVGPLYCDHIRLRPEYSEGCPRLAQPAGKGPVLPRIAEGALFWGSMVPTRIA